MSCGKSFLWSGIRQRRQRSTAYCDGYRRHGRHWLEYARKGVTFNTISPGYIATKMMTAIPKDVLNSKIIPQIPVGRLGTPEEVAALVAFVCSDEAGFMTGANLALNGGQHMY